MTSIEMIDLCRPAVGTILNKYVYQIFLRYVGALKGRVAGGRSGASGGDEDNYTSDKVTLGHKEGHFIGSCGP